MATPIFWAYASLDLSVIRAVLVKSKCQVMLLSDFSVEFISFQFKYALSIGAASPQWAEAEDSKENIKGALSTLDISLCLFSYV